MKKKPPPASSGESAPMWVVSFADMVSLLMAFFVMLTSFSAGANSDVKFRQLLKSLSDAFSMGESVNMNVFDANELMAKMEELALKNFKANKSVDGSGDSGRVNTVKRVREGIEFTIGGQIGFDPGSAELRGEAKDALREVCVYIRGENNKIEIRGHATKSEAGRDKPFSTDHALAYARACAVADYMATQGIQPQRLRRTDCGSTEPLVLRAYDEQTKEANRRVEIIVTQALVQQFEGAEGETVPPPPRASGSRTASPASQPH